MTYGEIAAAAQATGLAVVGAFHPAGGDGVPEGTGTLLLLGPADAAMWRAFSAAPEAADGRPDPLDRWSRRVIGALAAGFGGTALFPFGGPPWHPFGRWAGRGEGAVRSPVAMGASPSRGLWASYRGAVGLPARLALPQRSFADPCRGCPAPCLTACPVDAFARGAYDVPRCVAHVLGAAGAACLAGCLVRVSCPAGAGMELPPGQRAFHMAAFLAANAAVVPTNAHEICGEREGEIDEPALRLRSRTP
jgi:epoxyqueuosine reductase